MNRKDIKKLISSKKDWGEMPMIDPPYFILSTLGGIIGTSIKWLKAWIGYKKK